MAAKKVEETAESFQSLINGTVLSGFKLTGISLGVKLKLFKAFDGTMTSQELAYKVDCKERYVREWLHHMVMCDVVDVDESGTKFSLPDHRKTILTGDTSMISMMGASFPAMHIPHKEILDCFRNDGPIGLPFEKVLPFFAERALVNRKGLSFCADFIRDNIPGIKEKLESGIKVCEIGTGNGELTLHLAAQFLKSEFAGFDLSVDLLNQAKETLSKTSLKNVTFSIQDATDLPLEWNGSFDLITIRDVLHDIAHVSKALESFYRVLKPGGKMSVIEVNLSSNPYKSHQNPQQKMIGQLAYIISTYHCLPASLVVPGSAGLGAGSGIENIGKLMEEAGFVLDGETRPADYFNVLFIATKPLST